MQTKGEAVRIVRQVGSGTSAIPGHVIPPKSAAAEGGMCLAERNHSFEEPEDVPTRMELAPVKPPDFVVLVIRVVVAKLGFEELIPGPEHRDSVRQHQQTTEVLDLLPPQG